MHPWIRRLLLLLGVVLVAVLLTATKPQPADRCVRLYATGDSLEVLVHDPPCGQFSGPSPTDRHWRIDADLRNCSVFVLFSTEQTRLRKRTVECEFQRRTEAP